MVTYDVLMSWDPGALGTVGDDLTTSRRTILDLQDELDDGRPPYTWIGDSAETARTSHTTLVADLNDIVSPVSEVINALDEASATIASAKRRARGAMATINEKGLEVSFSGGTVTVRDPDADGEDRPETSELESLATTLADALSDADQADTDLAAVLRSARRGAYDGGTGSLGDAALPSELRGLSDASLIQQLLAHPDRYDGYINALTDEQQGALGTAIADETEGIRTGDEEIPPEELERVTDLLEAYGTDAEVSTGFLNRTGPEGLLDLQQRAAFFGRGDDTGEGLENGDELRDLQRALGATLAAGTQNIGDSDPGAADHVSTEWKWDLIGAGRDVFTVPGDISDIEVRGYQLIAPLLADGSAFDPDFLESVAATTVDFERDWDWDEHPEGPWDFPGIVGDGVRWDFTQGHDDEHDALGHDPIPGVLRGIADNPEAAREFFTSAVTYDGDEPYGTRVNYLLYERADEFRWPNDLQYPNHDGPPPGLALVGDALQAATIEGEPDERSVQVVQDLVHLSYDRFQDADDSFSGSDFIPPSLREDLATITSHYIGSFHHELGVNPGGGDLTDDYVFDDARFADPDQSARFLLAELAKDDVGREELRIASNAWTADQLTRNLDGITDPDDVRDELVPVISTNYDVLGAIDFGASRDIAQDNLSADERHNAGVDLGTNIVSTVLGQTPVGANPVGGFLLDQVLSGIGDSLHQDSTGATNQEVGDLYSSSAQTAQEIVRDTYWHSLPADAYPDGLGPDTNLNDLTASQADAYEDWLDDNPWGERLATELSQLENDHGSSLDRSEQILEDYGW
ncbi:hypothetical protein [Nocardioides sp. WS12]|uniref:hypothetical protein n=1 Tax=Nocardioides sp. WS12 TaxID=2486272 RepID=UPI0015FA935A|nr:hypothetical protein [Nocardioides sp. WS12]